MADKTIQPAETPADQTTIDALTAELASVKAELEKANAANALPPAKADTAPALLTGSGQVFRVLHDAIGSPGTFGPFYKGETIYESQIGPNLVFILSKGAIEPLTLTADNRYVSESGAPPPASRIGEIEAKLAAVNEANLLTPDGQKTAALQQNAQAIQATATAQSVAAEKPIS